MSAEDTEAADAVGLFVGIRKGALVVELALSGLGYAAPYALDQDGTDRWSVTDENEFGRAVLIELLRESEDGTTIVHEMFDEVFRRAVDMGAEGIEEGESPEGIEEGPPPPRGSQRWTYWTGTDRGEQ